MVARWVVAWENWQANGPRPSPGSSEPPGGRRRIPPERRWDVCTPQRTARHTIPAPAPVAQRIEQPVSTRLVGGSSPSGRTTWLVRSTFATRRTSEAGSVHQPVHQRGLWDRCKPLTSAQARRGKPEQACRSPAAAPMSSTVWGDQPPAAPTRPLVALAAQKNKVTDLTRQAHVSADSPEFRDVVARGATQNTQVLPKAEDGGGSASAVGMCQASTVSTPHGSFATALSARMSRWFMTSSMGIAPSKAMAPRASLRRLGCGREGAQQGKAIPLHQEGPASRDRRRQRAERSTPAIGPPEMALQALHRYARTSPSTRARARWSLGGGCVAGPLFSYPGAFLAASRGSGVSRLAPVLQDTQNGPRIRRRRVARVSRR